MRLLWREQLLAGQMTGRCLSIGTSLLPRLPLWCRIPYQCSFSVASMIGVRCGHDLSLWQLCAVVSALAAAFSVSFLSWLHAGSVCCCWLATLKCFEFSCSSFRSIYVCCLSSSAMIVRATNDTLAFFATLVTCHIL